MMNQLFWSRRGIVLGCTLALACAGEDASDSERAALTPADAGQSGAAGAGGAGCDGAACGGAAPSSAGGASVGVSGMSGGPAAPQGPLPDLVLDAPYLLDTTVEDVVDTNDMCLMNEGCVTGLGERRVVRFGSRMGNVGSADLRLGNPSEQNPFWTYDACHDTFDLVGFARYALLDASTGEVVVTGAKNGYCIRDSESWQTEGGPSCESYDCSEQGIGQGCADNYGSALECQWVDITNVPPGAYELRVTINAARSVTELDYDNNVVTVGLQISDDEVQVAR